ncbi:MAG: hypothetical protein IJL17_05470 [Kiritimatiellae bacterium]|nr:hypothetical protein [Kiritimatiellia bacterium]
MTIRVLSRWPYDHASDLDFEVTIAALKDDWWQAAYLYRRWIWKSLILAPRTFRRL